MTRVVLLARGAFNIPRTEAETQQQGFSLEGEHETALSACLLHDQERRGAPTQRGGCGGLPRAGLEGENHRTR